jgi:heme A synthase
MNISQIYILISIAVLLIIGLLIFFVRKDKKSKRLTPLAGLAFGFILAGIIFGDDIIISYSLMGIGVILAIIDIFKHFKKK